jgi:Lipopolysaccharide kinase (Kdo/WaaP) family
VAEPNVFELRAAGRWKLLVRADRWNAALSEQTMALVSAASSGKHPQTVRLSADTGGETRSFLKIYSPPQGVGSIKDLLRDSKAMRALKMTAALTGRGFHAPPPLAAGEERIAGRLGKAFLITAEIAGAPLPQVVGDRFTAPADPSRLRTKRAWIRQLAEEIRRFHDAGFVHGDLVASNIFIAVGEGERPTFYFMDHDRTRRYPRALARLLARRNLVQLNRFDLAAISRSDRARFIRHYSGRKDHRLNLWLVRETRRRYGSNRRMLIEPKRERVADQIR